MNINQIQDNIIYTQATGTLIKEDYEKLQNQLSENNEKLQNKQTTQTNNTTKQVLLEPNQTNPNQTPNGEVGPPQYCS